MIGYYHAGYLTSVADGGNAPANVPYLINGTTAVVGLSAEVLIGALTTGLTFTETTATADSTATFNLEITGAVGGNAILASVYQTSIPGSITGSVIAGNFSCDLDPNGNTIAQGISVYAGLSTSGGTGTVTTSYCVYAQSTFNGSSTVTNHRCVYIQNATGGGTVTNLYGLVLENQTMGGTLNWNLYVNATSSGGNSAIGGKLRVSDTTAPTAALDVGGVHTFTITAGGSSVINETGADIDFRLEGDTNANLITVDAGRDTIDFGSAAGANITYRARFSFPSLTVDAGSSGNCFTFAPLLTKAGSGTHTLMVGMGIGALVVTDNAGSNVGDATTVRIAGGPTGITPSGNSYAFWVDADNSRFDGTIRGADGSASAPEFTFESDAGNGMYLSGTDTVSFATNGVLRFSISTSAVTSTLVFLGPDGSASAPTYSISGDTDTGMYSKAANQLAFATGGSQRAAFDGGNGSNTAGMTLWDNDSGAVQRVKVGANGSGSLTNHRMLQVPDA